MKTSLLTHLMTFGALAIMGSVNFSCNGTGSAGYNANFDPGASAGGLPTTNLGSGAGNALTGLGLGQDTLQQVSAATQYGESNSNTSDTNGSQFAATAAPAGTLNKNPNANGIGGSGGNSPTSGSLANLREGSSGSGGTSSAASGSGSNGGGVAALGDTHTAPIVDPGKLGPNGNGTMSAVDALGPSSSSNQSAYAAGGGGGGAAGRSSNPFASLFGRDGGGGGDGSVTTEFSRSPASLAGQAGAGIGSGPMGSQDPANYFTLLNTDDNLFKIVERRYVSKSKQWAVSDAQDIRRSINR